MLSNRFSDFAGLHWFHLSSLYSHACTSSTQLHFPFLALQVYIYIYIYIYICIYITESAPGTGRWFGGLLALKGEGCKGEGGPRCWTTWSGWCIESMCILKVFDIWKNNWWLYFILFFIFHVIILIFAFLITFILINCLIVLSWITQTLFYAYF